MGLVRNLLFYNIITIFCILSAAAAQSGSLGSRMRQGSQNWGLFPRAKRSYGSGCGSFRVRVTITGRDSPRFPVLPYCFRLFLLEIVGRAGRRLQMESINSLCFIDKKRKNAANDSGQHIGDAKYFYSNYNCGDWDVQRGPECC